jgi:RNA polymerase sigma-70 factor, ECF subfamily
MNTPCAIVEDHTNGDISGCSDEELVSLAKTGAHSAYVELCQRHRLTAFYVINRVTKNWEDSEDALQETFLKVYLHLAGFDGRAKFSTWLTRVAINSALMSIRKRKSHPTQSLDEMTDGEVQHLGRFRPVPTPEAQAAQSEMLSLLHEAVDRLPLTLRGVTKIRQAEDLSISEIANISGLSVAAAKSRLRRARRELTLTINGAA